DAFRRTGIGRDVGARSGGVRVPVGGGTDASSAGPVRIVIADNRRLIGDAIAALIERNGRIMVAANVVDADAIAAVAAQSPAVLPTGWKRAIAAERDDPLVTLSKRQMEVLQLLAQGCSYEEIGMRLFISLNTVKFHVQSIFSRLGVRNRMAAARILDNRH